jgi:hypothetical protein
MAGRQLVKVVRLASTTPGRRPASMRRMASTLMWTTSASAGGRLAVIADSTAASGPKTTTSTSAGRAPSKYSTNRSAPPISIESVATARR